MTSMTIAPTGSALGEFDAPANWKVAEGSTGQWVTTRLRNVENSSIRDALDMFDAALSATSLFLLFFGPQAARTVEIVGDRGEVSFDWLIETDTDGGGATVGSVFEPVASSEPLEQRPAVTVVEQLVAMLGMPKRDVLRAAGISKSTFHTWDQPNGPRPRTASQGRLWALAELVDDLTDYLGARDRVGPWLLADNARRSLLRAGEFDAVLNLAAPASVADTGTPYLSGLFAAGEEKQPPQATVGAAARHRGPSSVRSTARRIRNTHDSGSTH
jgi:hypothetical protein